MRMGRQDGGIATHSLPVCLLCARVLEITSDKWILDKRTLDDWERHVQLYQHTGINSERGPTCDVSSHFPNVISLGFSPRRGGGADCWER